MAVAVKVADHAVRDFADLSGDVPQEGSESLPLIGNSRNESSSKMIAQI